MSETDGASDTKPRRDKEIDRLRQLYDRRPTDETEFSFQGVLLSDAIHQCVVSFGLITPFNEKNLKPACYKLTIGDQYALGGKICNLTDEAGNNKITIPPFAVAVLKTHETINMPRFLIGRWNLQVPRAYQGLLWVGGPQVDAGYVGYLYCPIYNLSSEEVVLKKGEPIAVIDFVRTSAFNRDSIPYRFPPDKVLFEEYDPDKLVSGLVKRAQERMDALEATLQAGIRQTKTTVQDVETSTKRDLRQIGGRIDNFVLITFSVIAVLFAAVTIFVSRVEQASLWNPPLFLVSLTSVFLSCWAWLKARDKEITFGRVVQFIVVLILLIVGILYLWDTRTRPVQQQINQLKEELEDLKEQKKPQPTVIVAPPNQEPPSSPSIINERKSSSKNVKAPTEEPKQTPNPRK